MASALLALLLATVFHRVHVAAGTASLSQDGLDSADMSDAVSLVGTGSRLLLNPKGNPSAPLPPIVFIKTHKVGGSTLCNILQRVAARQHLRPVLPTRRAVMINWKDVEARETARHQYDIVFNHEMFNETAVRRFLKAMPFFLSIVREPVAMLESRFNWNEGPKTWAARLKQMASNPSMYMNPLARDFGWYDGIDIRNMVASWDDELFRWDEDQAAVNAFIEYLNRTLDFVFPTENYDEGLILLRQRLPLSLDDLVYIRHKVTKGTKADGYIDTPPPTTEEKEALLKYLRVDALIHQTFLRRFEVQRRAAEERRPGQLQAELHELRRRNERIRAACDATPPDSVLCPEELYMSPAHFNERYFNYEHGQ